MRTQNDQIGLAGMRLFADDLKGITRPGEHLASLRFPEGVDLRLEKGLRAAHLLMHAGSGLIILDNVQDTEPRVLGLGKLHRAPDGGFRAARQVRRGKDGLRHGRRCFLIFRLRHYVRPTLSLKPETPRVKQPDAPAGSPETPSRRRGGCGSRDQGNRRGSMLFICFRFTGNFPSGI